MKLIKKEFSISFTKKIETILKSSKKYCNIQSCKNKRNLNKLLEKMKLYMMQEKKSNN